MVEQQNLGKSYYIVRGDYKDIMSGLVQAGLTPLNTADIMRLRLEAANSGQDKKDFWLGTGFDTIDGVVSRAEIVQGNDILSSDDYIRKARDNPQLQSKPDSIHNYIKIVRDAQQLKDIQPDSKLDVFQYLELPIGHYGKFEEPEFSEDDLEKVGFHRGLSKLEVKSHPVWQALARDSHLLSEYTDLVFAEVMQRNGNTHAMGVYTGDYLGFHTWGSMGEWLIQNVANGSILKIMGMENYKIPIFSIPPIQYNNHILVGEGELPNLKDIDIPEER